MTHSIRHKKIMLLNDILSKIDPEYVAFGSEIENICWEHCTSLYKYQTYELNQDTLFTQYYHIVMYKCANVLNEYGKNIFNDIVENKISFNDIPLIDLKNYMDDRKEIWEKSLSDKTITKKYTSFYTCPNCKSNRMILSRRYNRSLDEGVNLTAKCTVCSKEINV
jgi:DNA-directed RNA polymerase subunit M/transcription elongation factor TFIIS